MTKLQKIWKQMNNNEKTRIELQRKISDIILNSSDNLMLQEYIKLNKELETIINQNKTLKDELYPEMEKYQDTDTYLTGKYLDATLVKAHQVVDIDRTKFLTDYKENSKMYQKYVTITNKKGHVNIKSKVKVGD